MLKVILPLAFCILFAESVFCREHPFCQNPSTDPDFSAQWVRDNTPSTGSYILYGDRVAGLHWAQFVKGMDLSPYEDLSKLCAQTTYQLVNNKLVGDYRGYGGLVADRNCSILTQPSPGGFDCLFTSQSNPNYTDKAKCYITYVDKKDFRSFHVVLWCFENGDIGWVVTVIKRRRITEEDKATILRHLESIGIDTEETLELYADSCDS